MKPTADFQMEEEQQAQFRVKVRQKRLSNCRFHSLTGFVSASLNAIFVGPFLILLTWQQMRYHLQNSQLFNIDSTHKKKRDDESMTHAKNLL